MQKITPFLWFGKDAEKAARFYTSVFPNSKIVGMTRYDEESANVAGMPAGSVLTVAFRLNGQDFTALNGGPIFKFNESISFVVSCRTQAEIDHYWKKLTQGGKESQCGWLKDKYGVSWQVVPAALDNMLSGPKGKEVMGALLRMKKLDIKKLKAAMR